MEVARGEVWWADLPDPVASSPGGTHPVLIIQSDGFNRSAIRTVVASVITSNLRLAQAPGNVMVEPEESGLPRRSVINVSQVVTADKSFLRSCCGHVKPATMARVEEGLRLILSL